MSRTPFGQLSKAALFAPLFVLLCAAPPAWTQGAGDDLWADLDAPAAAPAPQPAEAAPAPAEPAAAPEAATAPAPESPAAAEPPAPEAVAAPDSARPSDDALRAASADSASAPADAPAAAPDSALAEAPAPAADDSLRAAALPDSAAAPVDALAAADSASSAVPDSAALKAEAAIAAAAADTAAAAERDSAAARRKDLLGTVKVSQVGGVSQLENYRSPRRALFMSLLIPGLGQFYAGGSAATYVRGGVYLALEATLIACWWTMGVQAYDDNVGKARSWRKKHFSDSLYETRMQSLYRQADEEHREAFREKNLLKRASWCDALYSESQEAERKVCADKMLTDDFDNHVARLAGEGFRPYDRDAYELLLESGDFVLGWDDTRKLDADFNTVVSTLRSAQADRYVSLRDKAGRAADLQMVFIGGVLLNHIVSAVDAALTAHFHNQKLYEREAGIASRISVASGGGFGAGGWENRVVATLSF